MLTRCDVDESDKVVLGDRRMYDVYSDTSVILIKLSPYYDVTIAIRKDKTYFHHRRYNLTITIL